MRNNGFASGIIAGMALGALVVMALTPQVRRPVMEGASEMGDRMRRMFRRKGEMMEDMMPGDDV